MKVTLIQAFKKVLSECKNIKDIKIEESVVRYFGGHTHITVGDFEISQILWVKWIIFKNTRFELEHEEWLELDKLVRDKKIELQAIVSNEDFIELQNILKS